MNINFEKASLKHLDLIFQWLNEPHIIEFWDNSQDHKDDILNFIHNRKQQYFFGTTIYWVGSLNDIPYCFLLSDILQELQNLPPLHKKYLSKNGNTITLDFSIGDKVYLGKNLAAPALNTFIHFYRETVDKLADTFFIDPDIHNQRAKRAYKKAGFKPVGEFDVHSGAFIGHDSTLMVRSFT